MHVLGPADLETEQVKSPLSANRREGKRSLWDGAQCEGEKCDFEKRLSGQEMMPSATFKLNKICLKARQDIWG